MSLNLEKLILIFFLLIVLSGILFFIFLKFLAIDLIDNLHFHQFINNRNNLHFHRSLTIATIQNQNTSFNKHTVNLS
jgi:hypothetical protein